MRAFEGQRSDNQPVKRSREEQRRSAELEAELGASAPPPPPSARR